ncbi:MAG: hypothetical protein RL701_1119 [Pseudomonadota bacterium]|jgi:hypothetical protein
MNDVIRGAYAGKEPWTAPSSVEYVDDIVSIRGLYSAVTNIVVLRRQLSNKLRQEAAALVQAGARRDLGTLRPDASGRTGVAASFIGLPSLADDIYVWSEVLAELTGCELVGYRLACISTAMCPRFHVDKVLVRVVCTLSGCGTEFLASEDVDRSWLGVADAGPSDEASGLLRNGPRIRSADPGHVVFLKGEAWPDNHGNGAVHRSPDVSEGSRLVLTLDALG